MENEANELTVDQAKALLLPGDEIHVFLNPSAGMLVGADWSREAILKLLETAETLRIGGTQCIGMGHGLVAFKDGRNHFIESSAGK